MQRSRIRLLELTLPPADRKAWQAWLAALDEKTDRLIAALVNETRRR